MEGSAFFSVESRTGTQGGGSDISTTAEREEKNINCRNNMDMNLSILNHSDSREMNQKLNRVNEP